ncbi:hypothetical protein KM800_13995 [Clostridium tyrobutyricum]|jgi:hypothetical protein|uniref:hypothetical protein n=1 Tax=Clostridium tyrobutyricum TaxID=1519 RepID=UPI001C3840AD|nr:hypothetical protein [Clostridium tyrobutyricum]MBV4420419.1 hypothetical protein [Clostridium tyrobutyricum]
MKSKTDDRKIKPVSFNLKNKKDCDILNYCDNLGESFSAYVKELLYKEMHKDENTSDIVNAINNIAKILENKSLKVDEMAVEKDIKDTKKISSEDKESKNIISNILNMGGKK